VLSAVLARVTADRIALHFHDTRGQALANVEAALPFGIRTFDASTGGLGGCPYAPGAPGNLATGDLVQRLTALGMTTGVSLEALTKASTFVRSRLSAP
jgi:hydroxymethylglutaryl-CoA lyase